MLEFVISAAARRRHLSISLGSASISVSVWTINSQRPREGATVVHADIRQRLSLSSGGFDHAAMLAVLEHLTEPRPVLHENYRILKPGGSLVLTWPSGVVDAILVVTRGFGLTSPEMESEEHVARLPVKALHAMLNEIGFDGFVHKTFELGLNNLLVACKKM
jgi:SAM-dependent methyltransferase